MPLDPPTLASVRATVALVTAFRGSGEELHQGRTCGNDLPIEYIWYKLPRLCIEGHIHGNGWKLVGLPRRPNELASSALDLFFLGRVLRWNYSERKLESTA